MILIINFLMQITVICALEYCIAKNARATVLLGFLIINLRRATSTFIATITHHSHLKIPTSSPHFQIILYIRPLFCFH